MQKVGLQAVFETEAFNKGKSIYDAGMKDAGRLAQQVSGQISSTGSAAGVASAAIAGIGTVAGIAVVGLGALTAGLAAAGAAAFGLAQQASPLEGVSFAFERMAATAGVSLDELRTAAAGTITDLDLMRRANLALVGTEGPFREAFANALPKILEGARAAAKATGQDINYLFDSLVVGVKRSSPRLIDNTGIVIKLGESAEEMAASIGKSADELTTSDQQMAVLNATLKGIDSIMLATAGSSETLGAKTERFHAQMGNLTATLGLYFLPAAKSVMDAVNGLVSAFLDAIQEGGSLYPVMVNLGAAFSLAGDALAGLVNKATVTIQNLTGEFEGGMTDLISNMFNWGLDAMVSFANGLIEGAAVAINAVADTINNILSFWFSPGSPPRVVPNIDQWGAGTMEAYLSGFASADFSVLKDIQGALKSAFDVFTTQGNIAKDTASKLWANISEGVIQGLSTGDMGSVFAQITNNLGEYAGAIISLTQKELALQTATKAVKDAETALDASRKKATALDTKRAKLITEYNDLVRKGASPAVLKAKMDEINATEQAQVAALQEVDANEQRVEAAKQQQEAMQEQVSMAKELIAVLTELAKASAAQPEKKAAAAGAKGAGGAKTVTPLAELPTGEEIGATLSDAINKAIEAAKVMLMAKWNELWSSVALNFQPLLDAFHNIDIAFQNLHERFATTWNNIKATFQEASTAISSLMTILWTTIHLNTVSWWNMVQEHLRLVMLQIGNVFRLFQALFKGDWDEFWRQISNIWNTSLAALNNLITGYGVILRANFDTWKDIGKKAIQGLWDGMKQVWDDLLNWIALQAAKIRATFESVLVLRSPSKVMEGIGENVMKGLAIGMESYIGKVERASMAGVGAVLRPAMAAQAVSTSNIYNTNVNLGGVNIAGNMTMAEFEVMLNRVISRSR